LPITLRGEVIGAMAARRDQAAGWSGEEVALAETIAGQLAQTIEGLRLLDETQRRAARERTIQEISDRMQRSADMAALMQIAVEELNRRLGGSRAYVRLGTEAQLLGGASR
jgi:GAF domain